MVYETALRRETQEMLNAERLHPEYDQEALQAFISDKKQLITLFAEKLKAQEANAMKTEEMSRINDTTSDNVNSLLNPRVK